MATSTRPMGDVWMILKNRKKLLTIMTVQDVSQRRLAIAAGYKSHAYMGKLLRGQVNTLDPEPAARIAAFLGVGMDDLFVPRVSGASRQSVRQGSAA